MTLPMHDGENADVRVSIMLTPSLDRRMRAAAREDGRTLSRFGLLLIREALDARETALREPTYAEVEAFEARAAEGRQ